MRQIIAHHDFDEITANTFEIRNATRPKPEPGKVLTRTHLISMDPYLIWNLSNARSAKAPPALMRSRTIGEVIDAGGTDFAPGALVLGFGGWQEYDLRSPEELREISRKVPAETQLSLGGHSGFTAWLGLQLGRLSEGETLLISGAAGAVGSAAGQLAKARGARIIGIAGGLEKTRWLREDLGFDEVVDHQAPDFTTALVAAAADGIDMVFENVGAKTLDPALPLIRKDGRVLLCGLMQHYADDAPVCLQNFRTILASSIQIIPFSIYDHQDLQQQAQNELMALIEAGGLQSPLDIRDGFGELPEAFVAMMQSQARGKILVRCS